MSITHTLPADDEQPAPVWGAPPPPPPPAVLSAVDEAVKTRVMEDALHLVLHSQRGHLPADSDGDALRSFLPVLTRETEEKYHHLRLLPELCRAFEMHTGGSACSGGMSSSVFSRVASVLGVGRAASEKLFTRICTRQHSRHQRRIDLDEVS